MKKTIISLLLCVCLLLFTGCDELLGSLLGKDGLGFLTSATTTTDAPGPQDQPTSPSEPEKPSENISHGYYYDQLTDNSRAVYDAIYRDNTNASGIPITLPSPLSFTGGSVDAELLNQQMKDASMELVQPALDALTMDHPEICWIAMGKSTFSIKTVREENGDGTITLYATDLTFHLTFKASITTAEEATALLSSFADKIATYPEASETRYDTLLAMHQKLCEEVVYDTDAENAHDAVGALLYGEAVCDGYARAFKLLCDAYEIPCIVVAGTSMQNGKEEPHAWNYVQMENEKWYAVDVTWDDSGAFPTRNYFLVGSDTLQPSLTAGSFSYSHRPDGKFSSGPYAPFTFPTLERGRYSPPLFHP